jgi:hypothetical protein
LWLPHKVEVDVGTGSERWHEQHRYSKYRLYQAKSRIILPTGKDWMDLNVCEFVRLDGLLRPSLRLQERITFATTVRSLSKPLKTWNLVFWPLLCSTFGGFRNQLMWSCVCLAMLAGQRRGFRTVQWTSIRLLPLSCSKAQILGAALA